MSIDCACDNAGPWKTRSHISSTEVGNFLQLEFYNVEFSSQTCPGEETLWTGRDCAGLGCPLLWRRKPCWEGKDLTWSCALYRSVSYSCPVVRLCICGSRVWSMGQQTMAFGPNLLCWWFSVNQVDGNTALLICWLICGCFPLQRQACEELWLRQPKIKGRTREGQTGPWGAMWKRHHIGKLTLLLNDPEHDEHSLKFYLAANSHPVPYCI